MIQISNDGSHTVVSAKYNVTYHSMHGAITESKVVFIDSNKTISVAPKNEKKDDNPF